MADEPHSKPLVPDRWSRYSILGSIGLLAVIVGVGLVKGEVSESYESPHMLVVGTALIIIGSSTILLSAAMWFQSGREG